MRDYDGFRSRHGGNPCSSQKRLDSRAKLVRAARVELARHRCWPDLTVISSGCHERQLHRQGPNSPSPEIGEHEISRGGRSAGCALQEAGYDRSLPSVLTRTLFHRATAQATPYFQMPQSNQISHAAISWCIRARGSFFSRASGPAARLRCDRPVCNDAARQEAVLVAKLGGGLQASAGSGQARGQIVVCGPAHAASARR